MQIVYRDIAFEAVIAQINGEKKTLRKIAGASALLLHIRQSYTLIPVLVHALIPRKHATHVAKQDESSLPEERGFEWQISCSRKGSLLKH